MVYKVIGNTAVVDGYEKMIPVSDLLSSNGVHISSDLLTAGRAYYTDSRLTKIIYSTQSTGVLESEQDLSSLPGNILFVCPAKEWPTGDGLIDVARVETLQVSNNFLSQKIAILENRSYTIEEENISLREQIENLKREEVRLMNLYKEAPFNWIIAVSFIFLLTGICLLFLDINKLGGIFTFSSLATGYVAMYLLWRYENIAIVDPNSLVIGFVATLGLIFTGLASLLF